MSFDFCSCLSHNFNPFPHSFPSFLQIFISGSGQLRPVHYRALLTWGTSDTGRLNSGNHLTSRTHGLANGSTKCPSNQTHCPPTRNLKKRTFTDPSRGNSDRSQVQREAVVVAPCPRSEATSPQVRWAGQQDTPLPGPHIVSTPVLLRTGSGPSWEKPEITPWLNPTLRNTDG